MEHSQILIVEDEIIVAMSIERKLKKLGYGVTAMASSGDEAIQKAAETRPDLVLMDIRLKGEMDGIEAAKQIHTRFDIPVVYLTSHADADTLQRAKIAEPLGYIIKPFQEQDLHAAIEMALYKHQMERKLKEREQWLATTLKSIGEAVIATDANGMIIFMNPVAELLTGWQQAEAIGKALPTVFNRTDEEMNPISENPATKAIQAGAISSSKQILLINKNNTKVPITDNAAPIKDERGEIIGAVLVFQDITERKRVEEEREKLITELQEALDTIKVLSGIIPICSSCKKIYDGQSDWQPIEIYITNHSEAKFSHGLCPECAKKLYPEFFNEDE